VRLLPPPPPPCNLSLANVSVSGSTVNLSGGGRATFGGNISTDPGLSANWTINVGDRFISGSGNSVSQFWNGRNSSDKQVEPGTYTAVLIAQTTGGTCDPTSAFKEFLIKVTTTPEQCLNLKIDSSANIANGNLYHSQTLFQVANSKLLNDFVLSYNSLDGYSQILGMGWTHSYDINLKYCGGGSYCIVGGDGKRLVLDRNGNHYTPETSNYPSLTVNGDGTATLEHKDGIIYVFNADGRITSLFDRNGNTVTFAYDASQNLTGITDSSGRNISFVYNPDNRITRITDPNGNTHSFTYWNQFIAGISSQISGLGVQSWAYSYDDRGFMVTKTDPKGFTTSYTYDSDHNLTHVTDPEGKTREIFYNPEGSQSFFTEKDGGNWTYKYDSTIGALIERTDPLGNKTTYAYDMDLNLISVIDPRGIETIHIYDSNGNVTSVGDALGSRAYTYNSLNKVTSIVYAGNATATFAYDGTGNLISSTDPMGNTTQYTYDGRGNLLTMVDPLSQATTFTYDPQSSFLTSVTDAAGAVTSFIYDAAGNMTRYTDPVGIITQFEYNGLNKINQVTDPQANVITYAYDANGNVASLTDANGKTTLYDYNYKGQATKITDALGGITQLAYGSGCPSCGSGVDKLTSLTDAKGHTTTFQYNLTGGLIKETDALGNFKSYTYDPAGNRSSRTDEKGNATQYTYDNLNRLIGVSYPDGTYKTIAYDLRSNISSALNQDIGYSFSYDLNNRLTGISDSNGRSIAYQYDALGNRSQMTTPDGRTISYAYNAVNRLTGILSSPGLYNFQFSYDLSGRRTELNYPNGVTTTYSYSPSSYLAALSAQKLQQPMVNSFSYAHDRMGNRTSTTDLSGVYNYTYDSIYQLTQATHPNMPTEQFGYDSVGNRISAEGETVGTPVATNYTYDWENRLTKVQYPGMVAQYKYDPFGRRIEKNVNGDITRFVYDGPNIVAEYDGNGNVKNAYFHNLDIDDPLAVQQGTNAYFYHKDGLGSVFNLTDGTGSVVNSYTYRSFGEIYSQTGSLVQPYTFTGREYDLESGLYYYRARYYDPKTGRFWTKDPIGFGGGDVNLYRYVRNNPINFRDPLGLYDEYVHFYKTYQWALEVGIEPRIALIIAAANQGVDEAYFTMPESPLSWFSFGLIFHFQSRSYAQRGLSQCIDQSDIRNFGRFLHMLQDSFSHERIGPITHLRLGDSPDQYSEWSPRDQRMKELTIWWLKEFESTIGKKYHPVIGGR